MIDRWLTKNLQWVLARVRRCEDQIWLLSKRLLEEGQSVVFDLGFSKKEQRERFRSLLQSSGHCYKLHFLDIPVGLRRTRVEKRNHEKSNTYEFEVDMKTFDWMESYFERPDKAELVEAIIVTS